MQGYTREESEHVEYAEGDYRVAIIETAAQKSKTGKDMIVVTVQPNGLPIKVKYYIVEGDYWNKNLTSLFDSFKPDIEEGDMEIAGWVGAIGAAKLGKDEKGYLKVKWFLRPEQAKDLPEWKGNKPARQKVTKFEEVAPDEELPF